MSNDLIDENSGEEESFADLLESYSPRMNKDIQVGDKVTGEIISNEEVIIEGKIDGKINAKNRVIVGKTGMVNADIDARELVVEGRVNGNVKLTQRIEIVPEGVLRGNINSSKVVLAEGSIFKGKIDMPIDKGAFPDKKPLSTEEKSEGDKD